MTIFRQFALGALTVQAMTLSLWAEKAAAVPGISDWPHLHGPLHNNTTPEAGWKKDWPADGPPVLWKASVGRGLASFAVVGDRAYTAGNNGADEDSIVCRDLNSGKELWRYRYPCKTAAHEMPVVPFGPASTPTVADDRLYMVSREGDVWCLEAATGKVIWHKHMLADYNGKRPVYGYASSVLVQGDRVYLDAGGDEQSTVCVEAKTGNLIWGKGSGEAGYASPALVQMSGATVLALFKGDSFRLLKPEDGEELARYETVTRDFCNCATPHVNDDVIFISHTGSDGSSLLKFAGGKLTPQWNDRDLGLLFNSGVPWEGKLIVFNDQKRGVKELRCLDMKSGETAWVSGEIDKGTAILSDGHLVILTSVGELVLARPLADKLEVLSRVQVLPAKTYVLPVLSHGRLLCKNNAGEVVCLDVK
ncbi:PQQ-binding-like beta-propeller repeat protein [Roseimicrobium sp. ORNL1]|uniref:outer membrane protein assembly factor BamB family protein n=1 Tax=Roseimicrobium sp. ORNL1 TaxID=2711231 RepID=UPI00197E483A|nr:PQQ-binding-like beta-propeller repeat protein [Roseimicrobium sp. ORNL1]